MGAQQYSRYGRFPKLPEMSLLSLHHTALHHMARGGTLLSVHAPCMPLRAPAPSLRAPECVQGSIPRVFRYLSTSAVESMPLLHTTLRFRTCQSTIFCFLLPSKIDDSLTTHRLQNPPFARPPFGSPWYLHFELTYFALRTPLFALG